MIFSLILLYAVNDRSGPLNDQCSQTIALIQIGIHELFHGFARKSIFFTFLVKSRLLIVNVSDEFFELLQREHFLIVWGHRTLHRALIVEKFAPCPSGTLTCCHQTSGCHRSFSIARQFCESCGRWRQASWRHTWRILGGLVRFLVSISHTWSLLLLSYRLWLVFGRNAHRRLRTFHCFNACLVETEGLILSRNFLL